MVNYIGSPVGVDANKSDSKMVICHPEQVEGCIGCEGNFLRPFLKKEFGVKNEGVVKERGDDYVLSCIGTIIACCAVSGSDGSLTCTVGKLIEHCAGVLILHSGFVWLAGTDANKSNRLLWQFLFSIVPKNIRKFK